MIRPAADWRSSSTYGFEESGRPREIDLFGKLDRSRTPDVCEKIALLRNARRVSITRALSSTKKDHGWSTDRAACSWGQRPFLGLCCWTSRLMGRLQARSSKPETLTVSTASRGANDRPVPGQVSGRSCTCPCIGSSLSLAAFRLEGRHR